MCFQVRIDGKMEGFMFDKSKYKCIDSVVNEIFNSPRNKYETLACVWCILTISHDPNTDCNCNIERFNESHTHIRDTIQKQWTTWN